MEKDAAVGECVGPEVNHAATRIIRDKTGFAPRQAFVARYHGLHVEQRVTVVRVPEVW